MNDLISESVLMKVLNDYVRIAYDCDGIDDENVIEYQQTHDDKTAYIIQGFNEVYELLRDVPTAYNVDKVIEELKEMEPDIECFDDVEDYPYALKLHNKYIEIVRKGGVSQ